MHEPRQKGQKDERAGTVVITDPTGASTLLGTSAAVLVAAPDAAAVGDAVARLRAAGTDASGWVGDPSDPAVREMAAELFPGYEVAPSP
jgi:uncharacterized protein YidB (DUF937 family)